MEKLAEISPYLLACAHTPNSSKWNKWAATQLSFSRFDRAAADRYEIPPYEEMALYYPQPNQRRPLILVGPPSIGRHELRLRLLEDVGRFAAAVPREY